MILPIGAEERSRRVVTVVATEEIFLGVVDAVRAELCAGLLLAADTTRFADDSHIRLLGARWGTASRSEEHTSELQSLMRISYAVFCLKKKKQDKHKRTTQYTYKHIPTNK